MLWHMSLVTVEHVILGSETNAFTKNYPDEPTLGILATVFGSNTAEAAILGTEFNGRVLDLLAGG